jgi:hypothetical protein
MKIVTKNIIFYSRGEPLPPCWIVTTQLVFTENQIVYDYILNRKNNYVNSYR